MMKMMASREEKEKEKEKDSSWPSNKQNVWGHRYIATATKLHEIKTTANDIWTCIYRKVDSIIQLCCVKR